jgi:methylated-DNA-[protein]-cysteine S-methyltransferase
MNADKVTLDIIADTPVGAVAAAMRGNTVIAVEIGASSAQEAIFRISGRLGSPEFELGRNRAGNELREYFAGKRRKFTVRPELAGLSPFSGSVLRACATIPFGMTATYGDIARAIGGPGGARAVGRALGVNPVPVIIPCHRVLASASLGGYSAPGGVHTKLALLAFEGARGAGRKR